MLKKFDLSADMIALGTAMIGCIVLALDLASLTLSPETIAIAMVFFVIAGGIVLYSHRPDPEPKTRRRRRKHE